MAFSSDSWGDERWTDAQYARPRRSSRRLSYIRRFPPPPDGDQSFGGSRPWKTPTRSTPPCRTSSFMATVGLRPILVHGGGQADRPGHGPPPVLVPRKVLGPPHHRRRHPWRSWLALLIDEINAGHRLPHPSQSVVGRSACTGRPFAGPLRAAGCRCPARMGVRSTWGSSARSPGSIPS